MSKHFYQRVMLIIMTSLNIWYIFMSPVLFIYKNVVKTACRHFTFNKIRSEQTIAVRLY